MTTAVTEQLPRPADSLLLLAKRTAIVCLIVGLFVLTLLGIAFAIDVLLMAFGGVLFAIFLSTIRDALSRYTGFGKTWSLMIVVAALLLLMFVGGWLLIPTITAQISELQKLWPESLENLRERVGKSPYGSWALEHLPSSAKMLPKPQAVLSRTAGLVSSVMGLTGIVLVIFFVGLTLAAQPNIYRQGLLRLFPPRKRRRAGEVLKEVGSSLQWWLIAKIAAMLIVGLLTWIGLWLLGLKLAATLAVITALLTFVPNFGPIISAVPAVLLGFMQGPTMALWVVALYVSVQLLESYVITPSIQYNALSLPPALLITVQLAISAWVGPLGLALATPLLAMTLVLVRMLYLQDVLHEDQTESGEGNA